VKKEIYPSSDTPYEDLHFTKEIVRMGMSFISNAIRSKEEIAEIHKVMKETRMQVNKLKDPNIQQAFDQICYLLDHNYPISEHTNWDVIKMIGRCFYYIDEKTLY